MDDKREFKINLRAGDPDDDLDSTVVIDKKIKQPGKYNASMLLVLLAFIVFGGIIAFLYYNLNSKIQVINTRGSAGIASLSNEVDDKLSEFSKQITDQKDTTQALLADIETQLKKLNTSVSGIQTGKLDKKDLSENLKEIKKDLLPLQESIQAANEKFAGIDNELQVTEENLKKLQTGVLNNKKEISTLDAIHIDRVYFEQELKKEREFNQQNMAHASEALFSEIAALHKLIKNLEKKLDRATLPADSGSDKSKAPAEIISEPKPGQIIEQEIK